MIFELDVFIVLACFDLVAFVVRRRRLWTLFNGLSFTSLFIALIDYFDALLKCIVEITDRAAATLTIHLQELLGLGSLFMLS